MTVYKLKGLDVYVTAYDKDSAATFLWLDGIGVTIENIDSTEINPNHDNIGKVFRNIAELVNHSTD